MKTGFRGAFVISWSQSELDGQRSAPVVDLRAGACWQWSGEAVRVDGPKGVLPLGLSEGEADIRKRAAPGVRRLLLSAGVGSQQTQAPLLQDPLFRQNFVVTDGYATWDVALIRTGAGRKPLLLFQAEIPPRDRELWVVRQNIDAATRAEADQDPGGVICFTPGTMILTPHGARDVADLAEGDVVQTQDNGTCPVVWIGRRHVTGARLKAIPSLLPVRLKAGALDRDVPDAGLLVSPDHRIVLRGARAKALFNCDEVLVMARDLVNDQTILRDRTVRCVTYIHMMLPQHEVVFANGVATESFHPASAALASMDPAEQDRLHALMPDMRGDPQAYGAYARRPLTDSDAAILRHDTSQRGRV